MGKNNRTEVAKHLTQQISATTDPQTLIELTKQLAKVMPKRRQPAEKSKKNAPLPDGRQVFSRVMGEIEKQKRNPQEVVKSLSAKEREAFNDFSGWGI